MLGLIFQEGRKLPHCIANSLVILLAEASQSLFGFRCHQPKFSAGAPPFPLSCPAVCIKPKSHCFGILVWVVGL